MNLQTCATITPQRHYHKDLPVVALLGVNKNIQSQAASFIFGRSIWKVAFPSIEHFRASFRAQHFWIRWMPYMRHLSYKLSMDSPVKGSILTLERTFGPTQDRDERPHRRPCPMDNIAW